MNPSRLDSHFGAMAATAMSKDMASHLENKRLSTSKVSVWAYKLVIRSSTWFLSGDAHLCHYSMYRHIG